MNKKNVIIGVVSVGILSAIAVWVYVFYLPTSKFYKDYLRNQLYKNAVPISANDLVKQFETNEPEAYKKFSGKNKETGKEIILEVTGEVISEKMDNGHPLLLLKSDDPFSNVSVTLLEFQDVKNGETIKVKGICTGFLSDVVINDGVIEKK